ncbi:MAG: hypothetical protein HY075_06150 [Deltaproteobacteria bacterium]|nr:hypothetical protein [Deltaproteobacteria bacterium]
MRQWFLGIVLALVALPSALAGELLPDFLPLDKLPVSRADAQRLRELDARASGALGATSNWNDIKGWRLLGVRWAAALDDHGEILAIYDLSLSTAGPVGILRLGTVGGPGFTLSAVRDALAGQPERGAEKAVKKLSRLTREKLETNLLAPDWFKKIPWNAGALDRFGALGLLGAAGTLEAAPARFTLADVDYQEATVSPTLFRKCTSWLARYGIDFSRLAFQAREDGGYDMLLLPVEASSSAKAHPVLIADLRTLHAGFLQAVQRTILSGVLILAIGTIPIPVLSALISTAVGRYLTYTGDVLDLHREAAREMVSAAEEKTRRFSAFDPLTPEERRRTGVSLYLAQASIISIWNWVFRGAETAWRDTLKDDVGRAFDARRWLDGHHEAAELLNPRYGLTSDARGTRRLYLLAHTRLFQSWRPAVAIDYSAPMRPVYIRVAVETSSVIVSFASSFIPWVGGLVSTAFDLAVRNPVQYTKDWEARLSAHLEERQRTGGENWALELGWLARQRVNPLELSPEQSAELIARQKKDLGLPEQRQSYSNALE